MTPISIYQVDAFTEALFSGNPAAICMMDFDLADQVLQSIAAENNLAETAFVVPEDDDFRIRWFTPGVEVDLCGHATLATAYVMYTQLGYKYDTIRFQSRSGLLTVSKNGDWLTLDFPADAYHSIDISDDLKNAPMQRSKKHTGARGILGLSWKISKTCSTAPLIKQPYFNLVIVD